MSLTITRPAIPVPLPLARGGTEATTPSGARTALELGDLALLTAPGGTSTFLRADKTWAVPAGGGGGAPTDAEYITSTVNATLSAERVLTDTATITWDRTTSGQIKANAIGGGGYTDEQAQDAVGAMLLDTATIALAYADATHALSASVIDASITEAKLGFSDVATKDASTTAHGLLRKLSGTATEYLNGAGAWTTPASGGTNYWSRTAIAATTLATGLLAYWDLEEATGNRLDAVGTNHLVPTGTTAQVSSAAGKIGSALAMNGTAGTYLSVADNATLSAGANTSFTLACWVYLASTASPMGLVGKGSAAVSTNNVEYLLWFYNDAWNFAVGSGASFVLLASPTPPVAGAWTLLIGWYDHVADIQYLQVNNGTPAQVANTAGSYDSTLPFEVGRTVGFATQSLNGRIDMPCFWKRVLTAQERADLWNNGNGIAYPFAQPAQLTTATAGDQLLLSTSALTQERLEVSSGIKLGTTAGLTDGIIRWTGTDFEGRKGGAWVSMTGGGGGQPLDATLTALAGLATGADQLPYATGADTFAQTPLTPLARTLLDDTTQAAMQTTLALVPGTHVQAQDAELQALAGLTSAADRLPYFTGLGTAALTAFTAAARSLAGAADAAAQRTALALGTMATQDASAVAITGGTALNMTQVTGADVQGSLLTGNSGVGVAEVAQAGRFISAVRGIFRENLGVGNIEPTVPLDVNGNTYLRGLLGLNVAPHPQAYLNVLWNKATTHGMWLQQTVDTGAASAVIFANAAGAAVGSISTSASATGYNTSSDVRLKHAIATLTGALERVRALRPVAFRWNANDELGVGFLAHELQQVVPEAVTGEPDAVNDDGSVKPQQVDASKIVAWAIAAMQELAARVQALEEALGV